MADQILDAWLQLQAPVEELDGTQGCFIESHEIFLVENKGVVVEQISQWLMVVILPITTLIFTCAGVQAYRTHGCSFDSLVLFLCGVYNLFFMGTELVHCNAALQLLRILYVTAMILYLYYNFEQVLSAMDNDMQELRDKDDQTYSVNAFSVTSPGLKLQEFSAESPGLQPTDSTERKLPKWRKCRRPYFWLSMGVLFLVMIDAAFEQFMGQSLMGTNHWVALRVLDLILSIAVFLQSKKLEHLLDEKEEIFLSRGYAKGRLSSPFIQMRRKQLQLISYSYLAANIMVLLELALLFGIKNQALQNCAMLCANPYTNGASILLTSLDLIHLLPTHLFLHSFYIIPRRFYATEDEDLMLVGDVGTLQQPLLEQNLNLVEDNINWHGEPRDRDRSRSRSRDNSTIGDKERQDSVFSGRLNQRIGRHGSSFNRRRSSGRAINTESNNNQSVVHARKDGYLDASYQRYRE